MKIYCSRASNISIEDFIGKDAWVKVHDSSRYCNEYVRFLSINAGGHVQYNYVFQNYIDNIDAYSNYISEEDVDKLLTTTRYAPLDEFRILLPLEIYTTEEIVDVFKNYAYYIPSL